MKQAGIFLGTLGLGILIMTGILAVKFLGGPGGAGGGSKFAIEMDEAAILAELERLRGLPGATLDAGLGAVTEAKVACVMRHMPEQPTARAVEAAERYFLVQFAMQRPGGSPLADGRLAEAGAALGSGEDDLRLRIEASGEGAARIAEQVAWLAAYEEAGHPIYARLKLGDGGWAFPDFQRIMIAGRANASAVETCWRGRLGG